MAKTVKTKKISITAFDKIMKTTAEPPKAVEWNGIEITIKHTLPLEDVITFVNNVSNLCFERESGNYLPEIKVFAIKCCVLEMYANFALPENVEHRYDLIYNTDAFDTVLEHINIKQLNEIVDAISEKVDNIAQADIESAKTKMNEIYSMFNNFQKQINDIFSGIDAEDLSEFINALSEGQLDESKIVQAYMDAKDGE